MNFAMDESIDVQKSPANVGHGPVGDDDLEQRFGVFGRGDILDIAQKHNLSVDEAVQRYLAEQARERAEERRRNRSP